MAFAFHGIGRRAGLALTASVLLCTACQSSKSSTAPSSSTAGSVATPAVVASSAATAATGTPDPAATEVATIISQPQPGATGVLMTGVIALNNDPPPAGSTLYLGLVKSADDDKPRTCIDAENNPVNDVGQFYAQVACKPQKGDQLLYVLVIGDPGLRDWHRGVIPMPPDLTDFRIDAE